MSFMVRNAATIALLGALFPAILCAQLRTMGLDDTRHLVRVADPQISPDGRTALISVSRADYESNRFVGELVAVDIASGAQRVLGRGAHARWSPAGDRIAFIAPGSAGGRQIHVIPAAGGEPVQVTRSTTDVEFFTWRPDGGAFAYVAADPRPAASGEDRHNDSFEVGNDHYMTRAAPMPAHLWVIPASGGDARRLSSGATSLSTSLGSSPVSWSPDGQLIAFVRLRSASPGDTDQGVVQVIDVEGGESRPLTGHSRFEAGARFSPDGTRIVYRFPRDGDPSNLDDLFSAPVSGGEGENLTRSLDRAVSLVDWLPDGRTLLLSGPDGTRSALWLLPASGPARKLDLGDIASVSGVSIARQGLIAVVGTEPTRPSELYVLDSASARPRRLTDFNASLAALTLGRSERVVWESDGMTADGVLTFPPAYIPARRYPLVLVIHGGPTAASTEGFSAFVQVLAAKGWLVFQPNYRGSNNLGNDFQRAIANDAGEGPGRDVVAGIDTLIARGVVDPERIAVSGWSYGGYMTAWLIGRYPDRWRAAVAGAAPVDITDMTSLTDLNVMLRHAITDSPWIGDNYRKYFDMSPIKNLSRIRTPTLILSNTGDVRVAVTGSYKLYFALKDNGVPVKFVAYPAAGHSPPDPVRQLDRDRRWLQWIEQWLDAESGQSGR